MPALSRRRFMAATAAFCLAQTSARAATLRIVSLDYGLASTLLSLGITPVGVAAAASWNTWVVAPPLPPSVADVGDALTVNLEALNGLEPDLILTTPYLDSVMPAIEKIAPCLRLSIYDASGGDVLAKAERATVELGRAVGRENEAANFLERAALHFETCRKRIETVAAPSVLLISFLDARHARIYTAPGLFDSVLHRIGLRNGWSQSGEYWGFQTIGIEQLAEVAGPDVHLIVFEPVPWAAMITLRESPLWLSLPFVKQGRFAILPETLMFGMVAEAMRFAGQMADYVETSR